MRHLAYLLAAILLGTACDESEETPERVAVGVCLPDTVALGAGDTLTSASQLAIYDAVLDSLRNLYGNTAFYLDPRVETVGQDLDVTRGHEPALLDHLLRSGRFAQECQADEESRCDVDSTGVNVRFSALLRVRGTDRVLVDVTQQTVRPLSDSSDWYFWASWVRYWVEREDRCWYVSSIETKGVV